MPSAASLVPDFGGTVHVVLDDFGTAGWASRETDESDASFASVVNDLLTGQFSEPVRVVASNTAQGWSRDVSEDVARAVVKQAVESGLSPSDGARRFVARYVDERDLLHAEIYN
jgi:hypothetical protein